jgi:PAS domain-containing protein
MHPRHLRKIYDAVRAPLVVLDADLRVRSANASFYGIFSLAPADAEGSLIYEIGNGAWDTPGLRERLPQSSPRRVRSSAWSSSATSSAWAGARCCSTPVASTVPT